RSSGAAPKASQRTNTNVECSSRAIRDLFRAFEHSKEVGTDPDCGAAGGRAESHQLTSRLIVAHDAFEVAYTFKSRFGGAVGLMLVSCVENETATGAEVGLIVFKTL